MLSLHTKQRHILKYCLVALTMIPVLGFAVTKIINLSGVFAVDYNMPVGFNDQIFYNAIVNEFKSEFPTQPVPDEGLTDAQLSQITRLVYSGVSGNKITDVTGLEKLTGLTHLDLQWNEISAINLSNNTGLTYLNVEKNSLSTIDLTSLTQLNIANVSNNSLTSLDISHNLNLKELYAKVNELTNVDFSNNTLIEKVDLYKNKLGLLTLTGKNQLRTLEVHENEIVSLDISSNPLLTEVNASFNQIASLNTVNTPALSRLFLQSNSLSSIDVSSNSALSYLDIDTNPISSIDLSHNLQLKVFRAPADNFAEIDFSQNPLLEEVVVNHQQNGVLTAIDLSHNPNLKRLEIYENSLTTLDLSNNTLLTHVVARDNQLNSIILPNCNTVKEIEVQRNNLSSIDVSQYSGLTKIAAYNNRINSLDLSHNPALVTVEVYSNQIEQLDVSSAPGVTSLKADNIPVKANVAASMTGNNVSYSLSGLRFLKSNQSINNADNYAYDSSSKTLSVLDSSQVVPLVQISSASRGLTYKLRLPEVLSFDANGGENAPELLMCYPNDGATSCTYEIPGSEPTRDGYVFLGWATTAGSQIVNVPKNSIYNASGYSAIYAVWSPIYTLSFDTQGGAPSVDNVTCYPLNNIGAPCSVTVPDIALTKEGASFFGYADEEGSRNPDYAAGGTYTFAGGGSKNVTIYAVWGTGEASWVEGQDFVKGQTEDLVIIVDYPLSLLEKILIDGVEVPRNQYLLDEENGRITIKGSYIDTLPSGEHSIKLIFSGQPEIDLGFEVTVEEYPRPEDSEGLANAEVNEDGEVVMDVVSPKIEVASVTVNIYDEHGALVKTAEYNEPGDKVRMDASDLPDGDYLMEKVYKDAEGNVLEVVTEPFTKRTGEETLNVDFETYIDTTKLILVEIFNNDGAKVRFVRIDPATGTVYVHDADGAIIQTIPNGFTDGQLVVPFDGLPTGIYDLKVNFLDVNDRVIKTIEINDIEYIAPSSDDDDDDADDEEIVVPDTGGYTNNDNSVFVTGSIAGIVMITLLSVAIGLIVKTVKD